MTAVVGEAPSLLDYNFVGLAEISVAARTAAKVLSDEILNFLTLAAGDLDHGRTKGAISVVWEVEIVVNTESQSNEAVVDILLLDSGSAPVEKPHTAGNAGGNHGVGLDLVRSASTSVIDALRSSVKDRYNGVMDGCDLLGNGAEELYEYAGEAILAVIGDSWTELPEGVESYADLMDYDFANEHCRRHRTSRSADRPS